MAFPVSSRTTGTKITADIWNNDLAVNLNDLNNRVSTNLASINTLQSRTYYTWYYADSVVSPWVEIAKYPKFLVGVQPSGTTAHIVAALINPNSAGTTAMSPGTGYANGTKVGQLPAVATPQTEVFINSRASTGVPFSMRLATDGGVYLFFKPNDAVLYPFNVSAGGVANQKIFFDTPFTYRPPALA